MPLECGGQLHLLLDSLGFEASASVGLLIPQNTVGERRALCEQEEGRRWSGTPPFSEFWDLLLALWQEAKFLRREARKENFPCAHSAGIKICLGP